MVAVVTWGVGGLWLGLAYSTLSLVVLETVPPDQEGSATASMELAAVLGPALGTGLGGVLVGGERRRDWHRCGGTLRLGGHMPRHPDRRSITRSIAARCELARVMIL